MNKHLDWQNAEYKEKSFYYEYVECGPPPVLRETTWDRLKVKYKTKHKSNLLYFPDIDLTITILPKDRKFMIPILHLRKV